MKFRVKNENFLCLVHDNSSDSDSDNEVQLPSSKKNGNLAKVTSKIRDLKIPHRRERVFGGPLKEAAKNHPNKVPFGKSLLQLLFPKSEIFC